MGAYELKPVFSRGELSPKLHSRADLEHFKTGLKECQNFMVMRQGGLTRRPGTQFVQEVKNSSRTARFIPFIFSASQAYMLVFNAGVFRVYTLGGRVGTVEVPHPYADADLFQLDFDQTNDVLDITHKGYAPRRVKRQNDTSWSIETVNFRFGPYLPVNDTATSLTPSGTGNPIPKMNSNTTPSGTAAASGTALGAPWSAFDRDAGTAWHSDSGAQAWLSYTFPASHIIVGYAVQATTQLVTSTPVTDRAPKSWTFEGSNDGMNWTVLDSQYAQSNWSAGEARYFRFTNITAYIGYRLNVTSNNGGQYVTIGELAFTEEPVAAPAVTITASSTVGINSGAGFTADDAGRIVALLGSNAVYRSFIITAIISPTVVQAKLDDSPLPVAQGTLQWRLGAWGNTPGWPAHVATFEQRKVYARTNAQPSAIWATKTGGYGSFLDFSVSVPVKDDDAISFTLTDVNEIQWIAEGSDLLIGTAGAARTMGRDSPNLPFSANNFRQSLSSTYASQAIRPAKVGNSTVFVSSFGKALREFVPADSGAGYATPDISVLSDHLFVSGITELCYAQEPDSVVWLPNGKGELIGMTYEKDQSMAGLHRHVMGGNGFVESCGSIPGQGRNEVWLIVRRTIGGANRRYIERMAAPFEAAASTPDKAWYLDSALQYSGAPTTGITGLGHLEGQRVAILADGAREADQIVTGGAVSLASGLPASTITVGLPFISRTRLMPSPTSAGDGSGLGRRKKIVFAKIDFLATGSLRVGRDEATAEEITPRHTSDDLSAAAPLATGFYDARPQTSWGDEGELVLVADGPLPVTIRSISLNTDPEP
ncbi:discoidin domain-containing protein [Labrys neptuniae]